MLLLRGKDNAEAARLISQARDLIAAAPIDEATSLDSDFAAIFKKKRKKATDKITGRQAEVEQQWDAQIKANYANAAQLAAQAKAML